MAATLLIVPHTHWDREWYETFEGVRYRLVQLLDELIEALERDASIPCFLLDGQTILIDDYLQIRPEMRERFAALARAGRITLGPWYVQPDEFLVSGESLVRNLQIGIAAAHAFGTPMLHGYVPDTFGHIAQLPQILRGFGIETFFTMRGLGADVDELGTEFSWRAPDGSSVLLHYLAESYSNGGVIGPTPEQSFVHHGKTVSYDSIDELARRMEKRSRLPLLLVLNGSDHTALQQRLGETVRSLATRIPARLGSLDEFGRALRGAAAHGAALPTVEGELRYGRYQPVLRGVLSTRLYLKQLNDRAAGRLEVEAERFAVAAAGAGLPPREAMLAYAWKRLLENHAHDSICGCSIDAVHDEVVTRLRSSLDVSGAIADEAAERLALAVVEGLPAADAGERIPIVVLNPSPWERSGRTEARVHPLDDSPLGVRRFGFSVPQRDFELEQCRLEDEEGSEIPFSAGETRVRVEDMLLRRKVLFADRLSFFAERVPATGARVYFLRRPPAGAASAPPETSRSAAAAPPVSPHRGAEVQASGAPVLDNGVVRVSVERDGTITLRDLVGGRELRGLGELVDDGDAGDEYTFSAPPRQLVLSSRALQWSVERVVEGLLARTELALPESLDADHLGRSEARLACRVEMRVTLDPASPLVRIVTTIDNRVRDHRLRVRFPTGMSIVESRAESAFSVVARPVVPAHSDGWREPDTPVYAQRRFVSIESAGACFVLFNRGLPEYEAAPSGELFLTLLRGVGWLSRNDLTVRPGQAGPELPTPGAQCLGAREFEYAFALVDAPAERQPLFRWAEELEHPLVARAVQTAAARPRAPGYRSFLALDNPSVVLSALRPLGQDGCVLRVFNPASEPQRFSATWGRPVEGVERTTLLEESGQPVRLSDPHRFDAVVEPHVIASYRVRFSSRTD